MKEKSIRDIFFSIWNGSYDNDDGELCEHCIKQILIPDLKKALVPTLAELSKISTQTQLLKLVITEMEKKFK